MATAAATRLSGPVLQIPNYRSSSPSRVKVGTAGSARSPGKFVSVSSLSAARSRRSCMCSPTNHPGSFRCSLHKERKQEPPAGHIHSKPTSPPAPFASSACRLVRPRGSVESGTWARRAIAPSPQSQLRRRAVAGRFRPRPSRLSAVSFAGDNRQ